MTQLKNFNVINPAGDAQKEKSIESVFNTAFDKDIISPGSFVRKVCHLLMSLCYVTPGLWVATLRYEEPKERFRVLIKCIDKGYAYDVVCALANGVNYISVLSVVRKSFTRDKITKHAVSHAKAQITANTNTYIYEKKLLKDDDDIAIWTMIIKPKPWYRRLFTKAVTPETRVVQKVDVLNYEL